MKPVRDKTLSNALRNGSDINARLSLANHFIDYLQLRPVCC